MRKLIFGILISALFLVLAFRGVDWSSVWLALRRTALLPYVLACVVALTNHVLRGLRWRPMLAPIQKVTRWRLTSATMIGAMANNVLPVRLGEVARAYALYRSDGVSLSSGLATLIYERIVDVFSVLVLVWLSLLYAPGPPWLASSSWVLLGLNTMLLLLLIVMERKRASIDAIMSRLTTRLSRRLGDRLRLVTATFLSGLAVASDLRALGPVVFYTLAMLVAGVTSAYLCFQALAFPLSWQVSVVLTVFVSFGAMIPSAPGNLGTIQYACIVGLSFYGVGKSDALAFSFIYHASQYLPLTLAGAACLSAASFSLGDLRRRGETTPNLGDASNDDRSG